MLSEVGASQGADGTRPGLLNAPIYRAPEQLRSLADHVWSERDEEAVRHLGEAAGFQRDTAVEEIIAEVEAGHVRTSVMRPDEHPCRRCGLPIGLREGECGTRGAPVEETSDEELARRDAP